MSNLRILHIAHCSLLILAQDSTLAGSWSQGAVNKPWRLSRNLLIADCGLRAPPRFMVPKRGQETVEAPHEPSCHWQLVTCNWRLGDALPDCDAAFNFQLPVTSYKLRV